MTFEEINNKLARIEVVKRQRMSKLALTREKATHDRTDALCVQCGVKLKANYHWYAGSKQPPVAERELNYALRGVLGSGCFHSKGCAVDWAISMAELASAELACQELLSILLEEGGE